jgi:hypothetical protein
MLVDQMQSEGVNERALTYAGNAGDADAARVSRERQQSFENRRGQIAVGRVIAFNHGNRTGQNSAVASNHTVNVLCGKEPIRDGGHGRRSAK